MSNYRDNSGKLPAGLDYFRNLISPPGPFMRLLKRQARTKVWKQTSGLWRYDCTHCTIGPGGGSWRTTYDLAHQHARQHRS